MWLHITGSFNFTSVHWTTLYFICSTNSLWMLWHWVFIIDMSKSDVKFHSPGLNIFCLSEQNVKIVSLPSCQIVLVSAFSVSEPTWRLHESSQYCYVWDYLLFLSTSCGWSMKICNCKSIELEGLIQSTQTMAVFPICTSGYTKSLWQKAVITVIAIPNTIMALIYLIFLWVVCAHYVLGLGE